MCVHFKSAISSAHLECAHCYYVTALRMRTYKDADSELGRSSRLSGSVRYVVHQTHDKPVSLLSLLCQLASERCAPLQQLLLRKLAAQEDGRRLCWPPCPRTKVPLEVLTL